MSRDDTPLPPELDRPLDLDDDQVPEPDAPAGDAEAARARGFAELVDRMVAGRPLPPAMSSGDRTLLETATVVRAGAGRIELASERRSAIVEEALRRAIGAPGSGSARGPRAGSPPLVAVPAPRDSGRGEVVPLAPRRRLPAAIPWAISAVAVAAAILLAVRRPAPPPPATAAAPAVELRDRDPQHRSRPADPLIGAIDRDRAGDASARLDTIYADRLAGYRDLALSGRLRTGGRPRSSR
jgi:hypothetical protein